MAPSRRSGNNDNNNNENPDIAAIIASALQNLSSKIGHSSGLTNENNVLTEYDGKGGAIVLTRWIEKMENVIDNNVQEEDVVAAMAIGMERFKALMVEDSAHVMKMKKLENEFLGITRWWEANHAAYTDQVS
ncbi:hypothetical protein Tco_0351116 [Tanacetum coccineum]